MNFNDVIALVNAGYTKAEIEAMQGAASSDQPEVQPAENPEHETAPDQTQGATEPQTQQPANAEQDPYTRLEAKLNQLIGLQQSQNINANVGDAAPARTSTDILGSVIAPPRKERKE